MKEVYKLENISKDTLNIMKQLMEDGCTESKSNFLDCCKLCPLKDMAPCYYITDKKFEKENTEVEYGENYIKIITKDN